MFLLQMTHWQSPHFHAYFPAANSYPAIVGEILSTGFTCLGFSWVSCGWLSIETCFSIKMQNHNEILSQNKYTTEVDMWRTLEVFKKRPNFLNRAPTSIENALLLLSAPSVRFWQQTATYPVSLRALVVELHPLN
jgi:hypothetical protein